MSDDGTKFWRENRSSRRRSSTRKRRAEADDEEVAEAEEARRKNDEDEEEDKEDNIQRTKGRRGLGPSQQWTELAVRSAQLTSTSVGLPETADEDVVARSTMPRKRRPTDEAHHCLSCHGGG